MNEEQEQVAANAMIENYSLDLMTVLSNIYEAPQLNKLESIEVMIQHLEQVKQEYNDPTMQAINAELDESVNLAVATQTMSPLLKDNMSMSLNNNLGLYGSNIVRATMQQGV